MPNNGWWWPRAVTSTGKELFTSNACSLSKCSEVFKTWEDGYDYILKEMYAVQFKNGEETRLDFEKKYEVIGIPVKSEKDSLEKLREMCTIPDDIKGKLVDIYNYMAINRNSRIELRFDMGIKFICEVNDSEWKNLPKVNLDDVLKGE